MKRYTILLFLLLSVFGLKAQIPQNGLVGAWLFSGNANDISATNNHGTVFGASLIPDRCGNPNSAYSFNGSSDYIVMAAPGPTGTVSRSVSFWARTTNTVINSPRASFDYGRLGNTGNAFQVVWNYCSQGFGMDVSTQAIIAGNMCLYNGAWHHIALVYDQSLGGQISTIQFYLDGALQSLVCNVGGTGALVNTASLSPVTIGKASSANVRYFQGDLDDFYLYNRALTPSEVMQLYTAMQCTLAITGPTLLCEGKPATYSINPVMGASSYSWLLPGGWTGTSTTNIINVTAGANSGAIYVTAITSQTCPAIISASLDVTVIPTPTISVSSTSALCNGQSGMLTASGANTYTWYPANFSGSSFSDNPLVSTSYTVIGMTAIGNCTAQATAMINVPPILQVTITPNSPTICAGNPATFTANASGGVGGFTYLWQGITNGNTYTATQNTAGNYVYTVIVTDNNACAASKTTNITFIANPNLTITPSQSICPNVSATLNVSGANTYTWSQNNVVSNSVVVSPSVQSIYSVTGTNILGCESTETTQVSIWQLPTLVFTTYSITCANLGSATVSASGGIGSYNYTWQPTGQINSVAINLNPNTYTVFVHDVGTGCYTDSMVTFSPLVPLTGNLNHTGSFLCHGATTGTANFSNLNGGSGNENYVWSNGVTTHTNFSPNNLSAGNWSVTVSDALTGCQIFSVFTITQPPALTLNVASSNANICTGYNFTLVANASGGVGAYSYSWLSAPASGSQFTVTPSNAGIHTFTANAYDYNNCFISTTINVNVVSPPSLTISLSSPSMCAQAFSGSANTITLTSGGANSYTLQTPNQVASTHSLNPVSELNSQPPYVPTGLATATLFGSNGVCTVSTTANFSVIPNPTVSVNNPTPVICAGQSYTYTSQGASSYTWSSLTPNSTLYTYGNIAVTNPSINSVFSVVGGSLGCLSPLVTTSITVNSIPEVFVTPTQSYVCIGNSIELKASGTVGNSYSWLPNKDLNQDVGSSVFANPQVQQTYTVIASLNNCTNAAVATVSIKPLPNPNIQLIKNGKCVNDSIVLKGSGGMAYQWIAPNGQTLWGFEELRIKANHESFSGTYTLTVYDMYSCANSKTQNVTINPLPTGVIKAEKFEGCVPLCNEYIFIPSNSAAQLMNVNWNINNKFFSGNNISYCFNTAGTHSIQANVRDENSCANSIVTQVIVYPKPKADFSYTPKEPIENMDWVKFENTSTGAEKFDWNFSVINQSSTEKNPSILYENTGTYLAALVVKSDKQCVDTIVKVINVKTDFSMYVPNVFSPNGDNLNDVFKPVVRGELEYRLYVFDYWGEKIFDTKDTNAGWDGTFKGEDCKVGIYVWKLIIANSKEEKEFVGTVLLER
ncbi:MAG: gliding motility-associated C-terminal domain-containing protein [Bacteroidetes bacterium]|nr:gliding motility-associated C-terminal domain-containing protein [Bacteroidota bacterium]